MCKIKVRFKQSPSVRGIFAYALSVEVVETEGMPKKIFVYHQSPAGLSGNTISEFDHVASPLDVQEIPEDAATETIPWYRTDTCTIWFRSLEDMEIGKQLFVDDLNALQRSFDILTNQNNFTNQTYVEFPYVEHGESSSCSSGSDSSSSSSSSSSSGDSSPYDPS